ncbi:MAG: hypothetical protein K2P79_09210 [Sphingomonas sp.]|jgi:hypothetical protein|nr:hypothetical protein [Sphingomonas sp.]
MKRALLAALAMASAASARDALGVYDRWGAFRDASPLHCYAIASPLSADRGGALRPFVSLNEWPRQGVHGQLHIRLSRAREPRSRVTLSIGERRFELVAGDADAWAPDARTDTAIVTAIRAGRSLSVETLAKGGRPFADVYSLRGAATAIDAAALGCLPRS